MRGALLDRERPLSSLAAGRGALAAFFDRGHVEAGEHAQWGVTQGAFGGAQRTIYPPQSTKIVCGLAMLGARSGC